MRAILIPALALVLASPVVFAAQIYKWVDSQGVTHFDAQPPVGQSTTEIDSVKPVAPPAPVPAKPANGTQSGASQHSIDQKVQSEVKEQDAKMAEFCDTARNNLAQLQSNPRVRQEIGGELRRMTEEERQGKITLTQKQIAENCQ